MSWLILAGVWERVEGREKSRGRHRVGGVEGRQRTGSYARSMPCSSGQPQAAWFCSALATSGGRRDPSRPIGAASLLPRARRKNSPCPLSEAAALHLYWIQHKPTGLPIPKQVRIVLPYLEYNFAYWPGSKLHWTKLDLFLR